LSKNSIFKAVFLKPVQNSIKNNYYAGQRLLKPRVFNTKKAISTGGLVEKVF